tara:strand:+ start:40729 stop:41355 length:627 start_codon:yes stop_codon:yes gene_type:complete
MPLNKFVAIIAVAISFSAIGSPSVAEDKETIDAMLRMPTYGSVDGWSVVKLSDNGQDMCKAIKAIDLSAQAYSIYSFLPDGQTLIDFSYEDPSVVIDGQLLNLWPEITVVFDAPGVRMVPGDRASLGLNHGSPPHIRRTLQFIVAPETVDRIAGAEDLGMEFVSASPSQVAGLRAIGFPTYGRTWVPVGGATRAVALGRRCASELRSS